jgi:hypothetical protein
MSFILDALKKSESERQRQSGPGVFQPRIAAPRTRFPVWAIALGLLLGVNLLILLWVMTRPEPAPTAAVVPAPAAPANPAPASPSPATSAPTGSGATTMPGATAATTRFNPPLIVDPALNDPAPGATEPVAAADARNPPAHRTDRARRRRAVLERQPLPRADPVSAATLEQLDGPQLADALRAGIYRLFARTDHINKINVFPVPDGDTGTNMSMTLSAVLPALDREPPRHAGQLLTKIADAALDGARGNSGAILAQFLLGVGDRVGHLERLDAASFAAAVRVGAAYARDALTQPREGTLLTVLTDFAAELERVVGEARPWSTAARAISATGTAPNA